MKQRSGRSGAGGTHGNLILCLGLFAVLSDAFRPRLEVGLSSTLRYGGAQGQAERRRDGRTMASPTDEEREMRRKIMDMQNEIAEDIIMSSEKEREARKAKVMQDRIESRKKIWAAYSQAGVGERSLTISNIGVPSKLTKASKSAFAEDKARQVNRGRSYAERKLQLFIDSLWIAVCGLAVVWGVGSYEASVSYALGAALGLGYIVLLSRYVESIGTAGGGGSAVGQARFALVILLVLFAGKYRDTIQMIPALVGFSMYQVASFLQAFQKEPTEEGRTS